MKEKMEIVEKINYRDILSISFSVSLSNNIFYLNTNSYGIGIFLLFY